MRAFIAALGFTALACCMASGQDAKLAFEVASVKPSTPPAPGMRRRVGCSGGPDTPDPGLLTCSNMSAANLVTMAYDLQRYQFSAPDWMSTTQFDVSAKIPPGTTKEQLRLMEQDLLAERFKLSVHHETKETQTFDLIAGKNGPKLKEAVEKPAPREEMAGPPPGGPPRMQMGNDGFPVFPAGANMMIMMNGRARMQQTGETMERFASFLANQLNRPVTDSTGLNGKYDIVLSWSPEGMRMPPAEAGASATASEPEPLPTLVQAVQSLGLKLEQKKGRVDILVVDHMERIPVEN